MNLLMKRIAAAVLSLIVCVALFTGCNDDKSDNDGSDDVGTSETEAPTDNPSADDEPLTETYVAKVGDDYIYSSEYYYFLYTAMREVYYGSDGVYDSSLSEDENYQLMLDFFASSNGEGKTYLEVAAERTLEIAAGFRIAYALGKQASESNPEYTISQETIDETLAIIDEEADYGAAYYETTRDAFFFYAYGMNVNDAKRYTEAQLFAQLHEEVWAKENGFDFDLIEPEAPEELGDDATDEEKNEYDTAYAEYELLLADYEAELAEYWEKFRGEYDKAAEDGINEYDIPTVRYLFLSASDEDGNELGESELAEKKNEAESYVEMVENGISFEKLVKGFSESSTAADDLGLFDINMFSDSDLIIPEEAVLWASDAGTAVGGELKIFSDDSGIYIVQKVGNTTFDETTGVVADDYSTNPAEVKANVEYYMLAELYNAVIEEAASTDEFKITEENREAMIKLAEEYLDYSDEEFENE